MHSGVYAGFLRYDEIAGFRFCDVKIQEDHVEKLIYLLHPARQTN